ncbi:hypothetical protein [Coleofasciculus sp. D1-CHI-01]|uniref:hypothetical protein n=1 Tax=Coleofasciculus sp. D1-CHI-01 TaxID=3068482 RepID=UPI004062E764
MQQFKLAFHNFSCATPLQLQAREKPPTLDFDGLTNRIRYQGTIEWQPLGETPVKLRGCAATVKDEMVRFFRVCRRCFYADGAKAQLQTSLTFRLSQNT